jgi:hypothetical protein
MTVCTCYKHFGMHVQRDSLIAPDLLGSRDGILSSSSYSFVISICGVKLSNAQTFQHNAESHPYSSEVERLMYNIHITLAFISQGIIRRLLRFF